MIASQFADLSARIFPKLQNIVEKERGLVNGGRQRTYLHKTMLRKVFSADQKWTAASVDTTYVKADIVSLNSPLPIKRRDSIAVASGTLPKHGMKKEMEESDINTLNTMKANGTEWTQIASKLANAPVACAVGLDESNEACFLSGLSNGIVAVEDKNNVGTALRIDFGYLAKNGFGVTTKDELTLDDIEMVLDYASQQGDTIVTIMMSETKYRKLRQTKGAKELVANYNGQVFNESTSLPVPTATRFDEAFADQYGGVTIKRVNRTVYAEKNGKRVPYKPWNEDRVIYLTTEQVGSLVWGNLAEKTAPVNGVVYSTVDKMKLISTFRTTDPLTETTAGQMLALTVIENIDSIYYQDISIVDDPTTRSEESETPVAQSASAPAKTSAKKTAIATE